MRIHLAKLAAALALAGAMPAAASAQTPAQSWPQRAIKMIVPFPAGGGTDFIARVAAKHLSDRLGQQVFVENRGGANGAIGLQALMQSDPDGYTIATCSDTPLVVNPSLYDKLAYVPLRDFVPVANMVRFPGMLAVHPSVPARSVADLIALAEPKRMPALPDLPAVAETVPGFEMAPWVGIIAPARTPKEIVDRLSQETLAIMHDPQVVKLLTEQQVTPFPQTPDQLGALIRKDLDKWAGVIKTAGIKGE